MNLYSTAILGAAILAAGCIAPEDRERYQPGAFVNEGASLKALADAVVAHCIPAVEGEQDFADFEMRGATAIRALADNKISVVSDSTLPVWQLADGIVQIQLDPYQSCEVAAVGLPTDTSYKVLTSAVKQAGYRETDTGYPQATGDLYRTFVSGQGASGYTVHVEGPQTAQMADGRTYEKLVATVSQGAD
ncbi:hypothetical protein [Henriciella marina]|uniref:hypothetical protein n=1 Tax=Henriciella marina TaxID=453851 RepID=UPI000362D112|nr:hypothetical protein [Henriciella marina]